MQKLLMKNNRFLQKLKKADYTPLLLVFSVLASLWCLHILVGSRFAGSTAYNTYTLQALAWQQGMLHLPHDYPWLELAIYEGQYYVSFPPLPSVILLPLTWFFGANTPDNLLVKVYGLMGCLAIYGALKSAGNKHSSAAILAYLYTMASSALPMMLEGAVWYQAQMLAFGLMCMAVMLMVRLKPTPALFLYALSVCCRPFDAVYAPLLYGVYLYRRRESLYGMKDTLPHLVPGTVLGLMVAAAIAVFNYVRFGNPLEFGHNYLPEFSFQGGIQFSLNHVANNAKTFLFGSPLSFDDAKYSVNAFGFTLFLACPVITFTLVQAVVYLFRKRFTWINAVILMTMVLHIFLLLLHRTFGGYQLGARYVVDAVPAGICYFALCKPCEKRNALHMALLAAVLVFTIVGVQFVHL